MESDVVVIGSGISGLTIAALLSKENKKVMVIEQSQHIGGYASRFERDGYIFETGAHHIGGLGYGAVVDRILRKLDVIDDIVKIPSPPITVAYGEYEYEYSFDLKILEKEIIDRYPEDKEYCLKLFIEIIDFNKALIEDNEKKIITFFRKWAFISLYDLLKNCVVNKEIITILSTLAPGYNGTTSDGSALSILSLLATYHPNAYYIEGGINKLTYLFKDIIERHGGKILTNSTVNKIIVDNQVVKKIEVINSQNISTISTKILISTMSTNNILKLLDSSNINNRVVERIRNLKVSPAAIRLYLILDKSYLPRFNDYIYFPEKDTLKWRKAMIYNPDIHNKCNRPIFLLSVPSMIDSTIKNANYNSMFITFLTKKKFIFDKTETKESLISIVEEMLPEIKGKTLYSYILIPEDFQNYTLNDDGSVFGWDKTPNQVAHINSIAPKIGLKNLYILGQWGANHGIFGAFYSAEKVYNLIIEENRV